MAAATIQNANGPVLHNGGEATPPGPASTSGDAQGGEGSSSSPEVASLDEQSVDKWGFRVEDVYRIALTFFKEKDGSKALHTAYKEKLKLVALTKQVTFGKYRSEVMPDVGFLDVVGNDRKAAWQSLGDMSKEVAMFEFVTYLATLCPLFGAYVEAHRAEKEEQERRQREESVQWQRAELERLHVQDIAKQQESDKHRLLSQEVLIRNALNQQTLAQFRQYAEQQCPGDPAQQEALVRQLQEQHFVQYMQQVYQQQQQLQQQYLQQQQQQNPSNNAAAPSSATFSPQHQQQQQVAATLSNNSVLHQTSRLHPDIGSLGLIPMPSPGHQGQVQGQGHQGQGQGSVNGTGAAGRTLEEHRTSGDGQPEEETDVDPNDLPPVAAASMWTRKDLREFKDSLAKDAESVIKVGSGELVTVRVPTHDDGSCLFWEFATDGYDIGFGVFFEWTVPSANELSVHFSESSGEDDEMDEDGVRHRRDLPEERKKSPESEPPTDEIIPVYRRDCQEEVYCGSHVYPGRGVYLLKFDNSYSLWRGKTVYYRVYYTR